MNKKCLELVILSIIAIILTVTCSCYNAYDISANDEEDTSNILEKFKFVTHVSSDEKLTLDSNIDTISISTSGLIALGLLNDKVVVMNSNGQINWWMTFSCDGEYYLQWDYDKLQIIFVRGAFIAEFDVDGKCIGTLSYSYHNDSDSPDINVRDRKYIKYGDEEFVLRKGIDFLSIGASKLIRIDANGEETVLYNAEKAALLKSLVAILLFILIAFVSISATVSHVKRKSTQTNDSSQGSERTSNTCDGSMRCHL